MNALLLNREENPKRYRDMNHTKQKAALAGRWQETWTKHWKEPLPSIKARFFSMRKELKKVGWQLC